MRSAADISRYRRTDLCDFTFGKRVAHDLATSPRIIRHDSTGLVRAGCGTVGIREQLAAGWLLVWRSAAEHINHDDGEIMSKRKKYVPRPVSTIGGLAIIDRRNRIDELKNKLTDEQLADLSIAFRLAYQCMVDGHATEENWAVVVSSLNIALVLSESGYGAEYQTIISDALAGAWRAKQRADKGMSWGFDGDGQQAIKRALSVHEDQIADTPKHALVDAIKEVHLRYTNGQNYQGEKTECLA